MPRVVQTSAHYLHPPEYPSAVFFRSDVILVADGRGTLYVLNVKHDDTSDILAVFTSAPDSLDSPFRIHSLHRESPNVALVVLSSRFRDPDSVGSVKVQFDVCSIRVDLATLHPNEILPLQVVWRLRGKEVPIYTGFIPALDAFLLIGGSVYRGLAASVPPTYEPSPDEYAPIPRANENLDIEQQDPPRPYPYSWTQTSDSVTVAFPLPSDTPKSEIEVLFSPRTLTLHVDSECSEVPGIPTPRYSDKLLWGSISPATSVWTWDKEAESSFGLLTLHLDKAINENIRWMQVFAAAATSTSTDSLPEDVEVPETLDPSELWHIRETLEKYTAALSTGQDASGLGLGTGVPSLGQGEMDEEVDQAVGREAYQTWVGLDGVPPAWWRWQNAREMPFHLLSTPLPGISRADPTFIIKSHIDGALFSFVTSANQPSWEHKSSYSALAFVLASKRDTRFTYHTDGAVFAFESGSKDRGGNVYIYRATSVTSKWAKQAVLKVDDGRGGSLLGVGAWNGPEGPVVVCLTEGELVMLKS